MADDGLRGKSQSLQYQRFWLAKGPREFGRGYPALLVRRLQLWLDQVGRLLAVDGLHMLVERAYSGPKLIVVLQKLPPHVRPLRILAVEKYDQIFWLRRIRLYTLGTALKHATLDNTKGTTRQLRPLPGQGAGQIWRSGPGSAHFRACGYWPA